MPRKSTEERAGAFYRTDGEPPRPPKHLSPRARQLCKIIAASRPPDFFTVGCWPLLGQYCEMAATQEVNLAAMACNPDDVDAQKVVRNMSMALNATATKLRLAISSIDKKSGVLTEREPEPTEDRLLFGGSNLRF
jgi:hypothetical protein